MKIGAALEFKCLAGYLEMYHRDKKKAYKEKEYNAICDYYTPTNGRYNNCSYQELNEDESGAILKVECTNKKCIQAYLKTILNGDDK